MNCSFNIRYKPRTTRAYTKTDLTVYDSADNTALNALAVYGKSEVVDGAIKSAGEGYAVVDLGTLNYSYIAVERRFYTSEISSAIKAPASDNTKANCLISIYHVVTLNELLATPYQDVIIAVGDTGNISIRNTAYTDPAIFKTAMSGVLLCYQLADPTQGNTIAVKTDDGSGIDGTMAVFSTGTPLRGIPDTMVRDVMAWDGSSGAVTKNCGKVRLADLSWTSNVTGGFAANLADSPRGIISLICSKYPYDNSVLFFWDNFNNYSNKTLYRSTGQSIYIKDTDYATESDFIASLGDTELVYELATPTTEQLTSTENASIAGLRTFTPQTHVQNNAGAEMTVDYTIRVPTI